MGTFLNETLGLNKHLYKVAPSPVEVDAMGEKMDRFAQGLQTGSTVSSTLVRTTDSNFRVELNPALADLGGFEGLFAFNGTNNSFPFNLSVVITAAGLIVNGQLDSFGLLNVLGELSYNGYIQPVIHYGFVNFDGTPGAIFPATGVINKTSTGTYEIDYYTPPLVSPLDFTVNVTPHEDPGGSSYTAIVSLIDPVNARFRVDTYDDTGAPADVDFMFAVFEKPL